MTRNLPALGPFKYSDFLTKARLTELERKLTEAAEHDRDPLRTCAERLKLDGLLTRAEVAAHMQLSVRQVQRMEAANRIQRCPGLGTTVRYAARDVLRLASAPRKER